MGEFQPRRPLVATPDQANASTRVLSPPARVRYRAAGCGLTLEPSAVPWGTPPPQAVAVGSGMATAAGASKRELASDATAADAGGSGSPKPGGGAGGDNGDVRRAGSNDHGSSGGDDSAPGPERAGGGGGKEEVPGGGADSGAGGGAAGDASALNTTWKEDELAVAARADAELRGDDLVGRRLRVYWPNDMEWFRCRVAEYDSKTDKHRLVYDDGDQRWTPLSRRQYEVIPNYGQCVVVLVTGLCDVNPLGADMCLVLCVCLTVAERWWGDGWSC